MVFGLQLSLVQFVVVGYCWNYVIISFILEV